MRYPFLLVLLGSVLASCIYENEDIYVSPIEPPSGAGSQINLNTVTDPITIHKPTRFTFSVTPANKGSYEAKIKLNGNQLFLLTSSSGEFYFALDPAVTGDGTKPLEIEVRYSSKSPSLAGQLNIETITFSQMWTVIVDTTPPSPIASPLVYLEDGKSMVQWNSPDLFTFSELILFRTYLNANGDVVARDSIKVSNHQTTLLHDSSYVGGPVKYRVDLKGYKYYVKGGETNFNVTPINFSLDSLADIPTLSWAISPLYNNDIVISFGGITFPPNQPNSREFDVRFGQPLSFEFRVLANHPPPSYFIAHQYAVNKSVYKGIKIPSFYNFEYIASENIYLLTNSTSILRLDGESFSVTGAYTFTQSISRQLLVSENGQYVYVYGGGSDKIYPFDYTTMTMGSPINLTSIIGQANQGITAAPSLSNDNIVTVQFGAISKGFAIDLTSRAVVWQLNGVDLPVISPDSKYIYWKGSVYQNDSNNWNTLIGTISEADNVQRVSFKQDSENELVVRTFAGGTMYFYDLNTPPDGFGILNPAFTLPNGYRFDRHSQQYLSIQLLVSWLGDGFVYDAETLVQTRTLPSIYEPSQVFLCNGHFVHSYGYIWP